LAIVLAGFLGTGSGALAQAQAILLKEIKDPTRFDDASIERLCERVKSESSAEQRPRLFERRAAQGVEYYAVTHDLILAQATLKDADDWELVRRWSFAKYPLPTPDDPDEPFRLQIHPALYPAGPNRWAVAVLTTEIESYAGGGANFIRADFVVLDPDSVDLTEKHRAFGAVPFSCSKMVRACFNERDQRKSPHCHDESSGFLTLRFAEAPGIPTYGWTGTWHESTWPAGVPKSAQKTKRITADLKAGPKAVADEAFPFCGGSAGGE
jgi:hypothetical protein